MKYIDTHCHLAMNRFDHDRDAVAKSSLAAGIGMLVVGGDLNSSSLSLALAERYSGILAAVGIHSCDVGGLTEKQWQTIVELAHNPKAAAIGETGLDYHWREVEPEEQKRWFMRHITLSLELGKPLSIHARDSVCDVLAQIEPFFADGLQAIWHCFTASKKEIGQALDFAVKNSLYLAVGGLVTFEDQKKLREYAKLIPDELLLLETDAPFIIPRPRTSDRNEPRGVIRVAEVLAELRQTTPETIAAVTTRNAGKVLGFTI